MSFERKHKVVVYCADVSGAFDKVRRERLVNKLRAAGVHEQIVMLLASWLDERTAEVVVQGQRSDKHALSNMVYQGTVLGPSLWNLMYADAKTPIRHAGFTELVYADDLNAYREAPTTTPDDTLIAEAQACQTEVHRWGGANQIQFEPAKEGIHVIGRRATSTETFGILGVDFDSKLIMHRTVECTTQAATWKAKAVFKVRRYLGPAECVRLYKC